MIFLRYTLERILHALPVILGVTVFVFFAIQLVPGDPIRIMMHGRISDEEVAAIYARLGMDRPLLIQYVHFVGKAAIGDLGISIVQNAPVTALVAEKIWPSMWLLINSTLLSVLLALPLALLSAFYRNRWADHVIRVGSMIGFAMPPFWIGLLVMLFFGLWLGWFPISGFGEGLVGHAHHMFLPSLTIALFLAPILVQSLRSSMLDILATDYVEVARAKGLSEWRILLKHVLRNALIPAITVLAVNISWLVSGAVIVEYVFSLPGLGSLLVRSVGFRDYPVIQGLSLIFAVIVVVVNLLADLSYMLVDRRVLKG
ncbi:ABC transporter permease [Hypericibacter terrae]|jgi:peptide/nickel transport system permease protein|uniref:ABC transporter permease n=1 Tax=Hypericibacter terrae TaxID=2602015 RepID=A0A5J6MCE2_9PROT|nr:ABC transporter permease [Hypericibacter terrae]QEX15019.1 ABC transporter permease [Hypericibacter terrae]